MEPDECFCAYCGVTWHYIQEYQFNSLTQTMCVFNLTILRLQFNFKNLYWRAGLQAHCFCCTILTGGLGRNVGRYKAKTYNTTFSCFWENICVYLPTGMSTWGSWKDSWKEKKQSIAFTESSVVWNDFTHKIMAYDVHPTSTLDR